MNLRPIWLSQSNDKVSIHLNLLYLLYGPMVAYVLCRVVGWQPVSWVGKIFGV